MLRRDNPLTKRLFFLLVTVSGSCQFRVPLSRVYWIPSILSTYIINMYSSNCANMKEYSFECEIDLTEHCKAFCLIFK